MFKYLFQGFILGLAYVAPIGMQNLYVINTAINTNKFKAYKVALITIFFDISLAISCFYGIGTLIEKFHMLKLIVILVGAIVVTYIGVKLLLSKEEIKKEKYIEKSMIEIVAACFTITWFNPQAIVDGSLLLGGYKLSLPYNYSWLFITGVCMASFLWFMSITTMVSIFKNSFNNKIIRIINVSCGVIIIYYGVKLAYNFYVLLV